MRRRPRKLKLKRASKRRARSDQVIAEAKNEESASAKTYKQQREEIRRELQSYSPGGLHGASRFRSGGRSAAQPTLDGYASAEDSVAAGSTTLKLPEISALQEKSKLALAQLRASAEKELSDRGKATAHQRGQYGAKSRGGRARKLGLRRPRNERGKDGKGDDELESVRREFGSVSDAVTPKGKGGDFLYIVGGPKDEDSATAVAAATATEEKDQDDEIEISKANFLFVVGSPERQSGEGQATRHRNRALLVRVWRAWRGCVGEERKGGKMKRERVEKGEGGEMDEDAEEQEVEREVEEDKDKDIEDKATTATISLDDGQGGKVQLTINTTLDNTMQVLQRLGIGKEQGGAEQQAQQQEQEQEQDCDQTTTPKKAATVPLQPTILSKYYVDRATGAERVQRWPGQLRSYPNRKRQRTRSLSPKQSPRVSLGPTKRTDGTVRPRVWQRQRYRPRDFVAWEAHDSRRYSTDDKSRMEEARKGFRSFFPAPSSSYGAQRAVVSSQGGDMLQAMGLIPRDGEEGDGDGQEKIVERVEQKEVEQKVDVIRTPAEGKEEHQTGMDDDAELAAQQEAEREATVALGATAMTPRVSPKRQTLVEPKRAITEREQKAGDHNDLFDEQEEEILEVEIDGYVVAFSEQMLRRSLHS